MTSHDSANGLGIFEKSEDIGPHVRVGRVEVGSGGATYRVTGGGANVWGRSDAFHFAWKRMSGDFTLEAELEFVGKGVEPHRKAMLMVRQDLEAGSKYVDVAVHGDGLTSMQFRPRAGAETKEVRSSASAPAKVVIERRGQQFTMLAGARGERLSAAAPQSIAFEDPLYVGLGVCSHNAEVQETVVFSNVRLERPQPAAQRYQSHVAIYDLAARKSRVVYTGPGIIEAPNWSRDGKYLLVNTKGDLFRLPLGKSRPELERLSLGPGSYACNNDHDLSPDGRKLAFSASSSSSSKSQVYVSEADGSGVRLVTQAAPSYFHGWSPDGRYLAFVAERGNGRYELYRIPAQGGAEERLTTAGGYDDGPEYTPDGRWIYFNSNRGGRWNIWRIPPDGAGAKDARAERVTSDAPEDWFPHISPDGRRIVFLSFPPGTEGHNDRMPGMLLRMIDAPGEHAEAGSVQVLAEIYGGQGTINVNSWSPDSKKFAYVVYEKLP
jgi:Tol biopolymer transport system component